VLDTHNLVSRRYDPIRLFNGSSLWLHYSADRKTGAGLFQFVSFAGSAGGRGVFPVSFRINRPHRSVAVHTLDSSGPAPLKPVQMGKDVEYYLPTFSVYAALEVTA
jgi:hypothetical protein